MGRSLRKASAGVGGGGYAADEVDGAEDGLHESSCALRVGGGGRQTCCFGREDVMTSC
jgi:hypothetical protein